MKRLIGLVAVAVLVALVGGAVMLSGSSEPANAGQCISSYSGRVVETGGGGNNPASGGYNPIMRNRTATQSPTPSVSPTPIPKCDDVSQNGS